MLEHMDHNWQTKKNKHNIEHKEIGKQINGRLQPIKRLNHVTAQM